MRILTVAGLLLATAAFLALPLDAGEGQGSADPNASIDDLKLGTYWYGAEVDKRDLIGRVVLVEIWGS